MSRTTNKPISFFAAQKAELASAVKAEVGSGVEFAQLVEETPGNISAICAGSRSVSIDKMASWFSKLWMKRQIKVDMSISHEGILSYTISRKKEQ
jgi:hypothetical protein